MKIAIYAICKNESEFLKRWLESCKEADLIFITDTGSTDDTIDLIQKYQEKYTQLQYNTVTISPWRFDDARNFSLMSLPDDIDVCICLDLDEVMTLDWREEVEKHFANPGVDRLRYNYIWSWSDKGEPGITYYADKIHRRHGMRWKNAVHEVLAKDLRLGEELQVFTDKTLIEHYPDDTKSRSDYLGLLKLATQEDPLNDRNAHYYARDLMFAKQYKEAAEEFLRHLELPTATWKAERAASMRYLGDCYWAIGEYPEAMCWFRKACIEAPLEREPFVALAQAARALGFWEDVEENCNKALAITVKPNSYICQPSAWSDWPSVMLEEAKTKLEERKKNV